MMKDKNSTSDVTITTSTTCTSTTHHVCRKVPKFTADELGLQKTEYIKDGD